MARGCAVHCLRRHVRRQRLERGMLTGVQRLRGRSLHCVNDTIRVPAMVLLLLRVLVLSLVGRELALSHL